MDDATTKTREQELMEQFNAGLDPTGATALQIRIDELTAQNKTLNEELGLDEQEKIDLEEHAAKLQKDLDAANATITALQAAASASKTSVKRGENAPKSRKIGPVGDGLTGDALTEALTKADQGGKKVEIVLSDGTREITGIAPIVVTGDVWRDHTLGKMLRDAVTVHGPANGQGGYAIDGYALLIDGKQVAYCKRSDVINVATGSTVNIADDIYF